jgi:diaminohydroxyphosphoribosylaminopyrimidine deaminase / 5-amino-6-(5-phosphoribosylamino)uracil reductase
MSGNNSASRLLEVERFGNEGEAMQAALGLARQAWGETHPNPMVGAVLTSSDGRLLGAGWHRKAGAPHAEIEALRACREGSGTLPDLSEATLYVTLEPCSTQGRTPPCTEAIRAAGIGRVVIGALDPNPRHAGRGVDILRASGIRVEQGLLAAECADLNLIFNHWITTGTPFLAAKIALTLDGKFATREGHSRWITGPAARGDAHHWRRLFPAIAVGCGTVLADDPALTVRLPGLPESCPVRLVFDRHQHLHQNHPARILRDSWAADKTYVISARGEWLRPSELPANPRPEKTEPLLSDKDFFQCFRQRCHERGLIGVFIEAGPRLLESLLAADHLDYLFCYHAPKFLGDPEAPGLRLTPPLALRMEEAKTLYQAQTALFPPDTLARGFLHPPSSL